MRNYILSVLKEIGLSNSILVDASSMGIIEVNVGEINMVISYSADMGILFITPKPKDILQVVKDLDVTDTSLSLHFTKDSFEQILKATSIMNILMLSGRVAGKCGVPVSIGV